MQATAARRIDRRAALHTSLPSMAPRRQSNIGHRSPHVGTHLRCRAGERGIDNPDDLSPRCYMSAAPRKQPKIGWVARCPLNAESDTSAEAKALEMSLNEDVCHSPLDFSVILVEGLADAERHLNLIPGTVV